MPRIIEITPPSQAPAWEGSPSTVKAREQDTPALVGGIQSKDPHKAYKSRKRWKRFKSLASSLLSAKVDKRAARHLEITSGRCDPLPTAHGRSSKVSVTESAGPAKAWSAGSVPGLVASAVVRWAPESAAGPMEPAAIDGELALVPVPGSSGLGTQRSKGRLKGIGKKLRTYGTQAIDLWAEHVRAGRARKADKRERQACAKAEIAEEKAIEATREFLKRLDGVHKALHGAPPDKRHKLIHGIFPRRPANSAAAALIDAIQKFRAARAINRSWREDLDARRQLVAEALDALSAGERTTKAGGQQALPNLAIGKPAPREATRNMRTAVRLAAADKVTRNRIVAIAQELQQGAEGNSISTGSVNELLDNVVQNGLEQAAFHYQYMPLTNLLMLAAQCLKTGRPGPAPPAKRVTTAIAEQFNLIFRGYNEPGLVGTQETRIAYLERVLKERFYPRWSAAEPDARAQAEHEVRVGRALKALACLFCVGDRERAGALRHEILKHATSDALRLQYGNLFDRLSHLVARTLHIDHNEQAFSERARPQQPAWADQTLWKEYERNRTAHPFHRPSRLRRFGQVTWFWMKYVFSNSESCAAMRLEYWEGRVDVSLRGMLKYLRQVPPHDLADGIDAKAQKRIDKHMRRLHDALDCLEAELRDQGGQRSASAYLERSLLQRYGELGNAHLHNLCTIILEHGWQPRLQPCGAWSTRMRYLRERLHPFRDPYDLKAVRAEQPDRATRLAGTWHTVSAMLQAEIMDQAYLSAIQQLAGGLRERDRDLAAGAAKRLAELDAQSPGETPLTPPEFQRALKRLSNEDFAILVRKLGKHSWDKGGHMEDVLKPNELQRETIPEDNLFYLRALLERLYQVVLTVKQNRPDDARPDGRGDVDAPAHGTDAACIDAANTPALPSPNPRRGIEAAPAPGRMAAITYYQDEAEEEAAAPALA